MTIHEQLEMIAQSINWIAEKIQETNGQALHHRRRKLDSLAAKLAWEKRQLETIRKS